MAWTMDPGALPTLVAGQRMADSRSRLESMEGRLEMSLVSIMMPCFNARPYLEETVACLRAQEGEWELIVVDDGSTDGSAELIRQLLPEAKLLKGDHQGIGTALNIALKEAQGEYLAWIDADDLWVEGKLAAQIRALKENPKWDGCFVGVDQFFHPPRPNQSPPQIDGLHRGALLIRREAFDRVGRFREDVKIGEFIDWCSRAKDTGVFLGQLSQKLYRRRIHSTNTMGASTTDKRDYLKVLKAALDRKRASEGASGGGPKPKE